MRHVEYHDLKRAPIWLGEGSPLGQMLGAERAGTVLDFVNMQALVRWPGRPQFLGDPNALLTYEAPSEKWVRNAAGQISRGTSLRCDHDETGTPLGINLEAQRGNLLLSSNSFVSPYWGGVNGALIVPNTDLGADGELSMSTLTVGTTTTSRLQTANNFTVAIGSVYTLSADVKEGTSLKPMLSAFNSALSVQYAGVIFDWIDGRPVLSTGSGTYVAGSFRVVARANGVFRISFSFTPSDITCRILLYPDRIAGGTGTTVKVGRFQLELSPYPTSDIITGASAGTRFIDNLWLSAAKFPINTDGTGNTLIFDYVHHRLSNGTSTVHGPAFRWNTNNRITAALYSAGNFITQIPTTAVKNLNPALLSETRYKIALAFKSGFQERVTNGVPAASTGEIVFDELALERMVLGGSLNGGQNLDQHLRSVKVVPRLMSRAEMIAETLGA